MADRTEIETMILNKITKALGDEFSNTEIVEIYPDQMPQHFIKPCLSVIEYDTQEEHLGNYVSRYYVYFDILLHIEYDSTNLTGIYTAMRNYKPRISRVLDYITLEAEYTGNRTIKLKKQNFNSFVRDGIGHIMLEYHYIASTKDENKPIPLTSITNEIFLNEKGD